jgi:hypothetical protein
MNGRIASLTVPFLDRDSLLQSGRIEATDILLGNSTVRLTAGGGKSYRLRLPRITAGRIAGKQQLLVRDLRAGGVAIRGYRPDNELDLIADGLAVHLRSLPFPFEVARVDPVALRFDSLVFVGDDGVANQSLHGMRFSAARRSVRLDSILRRSQLPFSEVFERQLQRSVLTFGFFDVALQEVDVDRLLNRRSIWLDSLTVEDARLRAIESLTVEVGGRAKMLPLQALRSLGWPVRLDGAHIKSMDITYGIVDTSGRPETIEFSEADIRLSNVDSGYDPQDSIYATVQTTFDGTTPLAAQFILPRDSSGRTAVMRGRLGSYALERINPLTRMSVDFVLESGAIDSLRYDGRLHEDVVRGELDFYYHNLDVKLTGDGAWIKNLLSGMVVKSDNRAGDDFRPGEIYYEHPRDKSFFSAYWKGLVSGLRSSVLSDILLPDELE